ncbi:hypothetical protein MMC10_005346 [Thelotrema lepadinum]|nr:hypothetical protein [Thelotrema lepadinum]
MEVDVITWLKQEGRHFEFEYLRVSKLTQIVELLVFWHAYRIPLLASLAIVVLTVRKLLSQRSTRRKKVPSLVSRASQSSKPRVATPEIEHVSSVLGLPAQTDEKQVLGDQLGWKTRQEPKRVKGSRDKKKAVAKADINVSNERSSVQPMIFYFSLTGFTETYARSVAERSKESPSNFSILQPQIYDLAHIDYDDFFIQTPKVDSLESNVSYFYLILVPTYNIDTLLNTFISNLAETHHDFRIDTAPLAGLLGYSVFGFGDKEGWPSEEVGFCSQAREIDSWMSKLTDRKRAFPLGLGDVKSDAMERLTEWQDGVRETLRAIAETGSLGEGVPGSGDALESDEEEEDDKEGKKRLGDGALAKKKRERSEKTNLNDLEDLGRNDTSDPIPIDFTASNLNASPLMSAPAPKPMVPTTSPTYTALTKQGYSIIGSHSGVKICRWTKSALRGRGSCYKRSFYGIASHLCMETTPSLSCSNKCVFCWRHGTNPVGTTWRWQVDPPEMIFQGAKEAHLKKIKTLRGVPGVRAERFQEAQRIRHCALSLVGEPIFYPHINAFLSLLHAEHISSFLVCNAQHPDQLAALKAVTQLYVSIDASNRDSLRRIDRPLHRDFWERFLKCLDILRERRHRMRTVFRLTLVKGFNIDDEVAGYADLVARGLPCFVEIKGVTYCGTSTSVSAGLTMANVPFYEEVCSFVNALNEELNKRGLDYGIAAEHAHSCCVLLASTRFRREGKWHTLIDYERFFELLEGGQEFSPEDYMGDPTPEWALWGNGGFDPADERVTRKGTKAAVEAA